MLCCIVAMLRIDAGLQLICSDNCVLLNLCASLTILLIPLIIFVALQEPGRKQWKERVGQQRQGAATTAV